MSTRYPPAFVRLLKALEALPGIGGRSAERIAFQLLGDGEQRGAELAAAIAEAKGVRHCQRCFNLTQNEGLCDVCADEGRDHSTVCVVETPRELLAIERSGTYSGVYHCLLGRISPTEGVSEADLTIPALVSRCRKPGVSEVILATNPDLAGDGTAMAVARALGGTDVSVSRLARGLPLGHQLEFLASGVIDEALRGRTPLSGAARAASRDAVKGGS